MQQSFITLLRRGLCPCLAGMLASGLLVLPHQSARGAARPEVVFKPELGRASYYGRIGGRSRRTASGRLFNPRALTAAHPWLPFGTRVRVTVERTGRSVVVTITDRLPGTHRIIDLSVGAAQSLGIIRQGVVEVALAPAA